MPPHVSQFLERSRPPCGRPLESRTGAAPVALQSGQGLVEPMSRFTLPAIIESYLPGLQATARLCLSTLRKDRSLGSSRFRAGVLRWPGLWRRRVIHLAPARAVGAAAGLLAPPPPGPFVSHAGPDAVPLSRFRRRARLVGSAGVGPTPHSLKRKKRRVAVTGSTASSPP